MFTKGEVVWAKLKGFPWWPATISKIIDNKTRKDCKGTLIPQPQDITVNFIGENSHATLAESKIEKFAQNFKQYSSNIKKKKLIESIDLAKKLHEQSNPPITPIKSSSDKNSKLKRKAINKDINSEEEEADESNDIKKVQDEPKKKLKLETPQTWERVTRSKTSVNKPDIECETSSEKREESKNIEPLIKSSEHLAEVSEEKNNIEIKQINEKKSNNNSKIDCQNSKSNFSSSRNNFPHNRKIETPSTNKKKSQSFRNIAIYKKKLESPMVFNRSKFVKKALVSSKIKNQINLPQKSVSDSTNDSLDKEENDLIKNLENRLKYGIEIVINEDHYDKNYHEIIKIVNECVNDIAKLFANSNVNILSNFLSKNIGKEMALLEKLCEDNKNLLKNLFNIEYYIKELKKTNAKIESQVYYQFFDCFPILNELNIPYPQKNNNDSKISFFSNPLSLTSKNKYDPYHTPIRNSNNPLNFGIKTHSSVEENEPHHSEISSVNNPLNNDDMENLKPMNKIDSLTSRNFSKESECNCDSKNHADHIENKQLRKKICHKMSKILQEKYGMEKSKSQDITLRVELKIRNSHPDMKDVYKEKIRILLKLMKECKLNVENYIKGEEINFETLKMNMVENTPQNKYDDDNMSNDKFDTPIPNNLSEFTIKSR